MFFLNLNLFQFAALFAGISAFAVALYLFDRSRRKQLVSTLRFWVAAQNPTTSARRKRIQQPWSLILQLISMALLLLAIAQLKLGSPAQAGRDHVVILETSAWMGARSGNRTLMDVARERARRYVQALPATDRVMLVRADALATPATVFETDHAKVQAAIDASQPGSTALNLEQAFTFARHIQTQQGRRAGEIAFIGTGRTGEDGAAVTPPPRNLRVIAIPDAVENAGLRKIGARRSNNDPGLWEIYVSAHNYGANPRNVDLSLNFGPQEPQLRTPAGAQHLVLKPGADVEASFEYRTVSAGIMGIYLTPHDAFPADDHADIELPALPSLTVTVYSTQPELLKPALDSMDRVTAVYRKPTEYQSGDKGLVILDRFIPPSRPTADSIWIEPPANGSPIPVKQTVTVAQFTGWSPTHPAAAGMRTKDFKLDQAEVFQTSPTDGVIGEVQAGPVIVARDGSPKIVVLGFHPGLSAMRYELAAPLLFANILRWVSPQIFRRSEISGGAAGAVKLDVGKDAEAKNIKVSTDGGAAVPFTLHDNTVDFFAGAPGPVRVVAGDREYMYSLTLPELSTNKWQPPAGVTRGIPAAARAIAGSTDVWPWLALAGGLGLLLDWFLFGRYRKRAFRASSVTPISAKRPTIMGAQR
jgi:hypothetical protein